MVKILGLMMKKRGWTLYDFGKNVLSLHPDLVMRCVQHLVQGNQVEDLSCSCSCKPFSLKPTLKVSLNVSFGKTVGFVVSQKTCQCLFYNKLSLPGFGV